MGVHELFKLLEPVKQSLNLRDLRGKIVAVDISIWLHQFIHGTYLNENSDLLGNPMDEEEHERKSMSMFLQNLFLRICKLWYYGAKVVMVFDGQTPLIKQKTVAKRLKQKRQEAKKLQILAKKLLRNRLENVALNNILEESNEQINEEVSEVEELQSIDLISENAMHSEIYNDPQNWEFSKTEEVNLEEIFHTPIKRKSNSSNESTSNSADSDDYDIYYEYNIDDIDTEVFSQLPSAVQQRLLKNLRRSKRYNPPSKFSTLKSQTPSSFASSQLSNFIHGRNTHRKLEDIIKKTQETQHLSKHSGLLSETQVQGMEFQGGRIASDENVEFILFTSPRKDAASERDSNQIPAANITPQLDAQSSKDIEDGGFVRDITTPSMEPIVIEDKSNEPESIEESMANPCSDDDEFESVFVIESSKHIELEKSDLANTSEETNEFESTMDDVDLFPASIFEKQQEQSQSTANIDGSDYFPATIFERQIIDDDKTQMGKSLPTSTKDTNESLAERDTISDRDIITEKDIITEIDIIDEKDTITEKETITRKDVITIIDNLEKIDEEITEATSSNDVIIISSPATEKPTTISDNEPSVDNEELVKEREEMIKNMRENLANERQLIEKEMKKAKKSSQTISELLISKTRQLLQVLGIPYVDAPYEADAQCGYLCQTGLVDGVISEDSDMLLFGCSLLYRHFFDSDCQVYNAQNIESKMGLSRRELIQLGMLLGCDYTDGVHGVGIVTGIQVCDAFNRIIDSKNKSHLTGELTIKDIIDPLKEFAEWVNGQDDMFDNTGGFKFKFRNIRRNFVLPPDFPDERVADAFINPVVDRSLEEFVFGTFDSDSSNDVVAMDIKAFYEFCQLNMNWNKETVDKHLYTVLSAPKRDYTTSVAYSIPFEKKYEIKSEGIKRAVKNLLSKRKSHAQSSSDEEFGSEGTGIENSAKKMRKSNKSINNE